MHRIIGAAVLALAATAAMPAAAHHGIVNFDLNKDMSISGTITSVEFVNPHAWLHVAVMNADGVAEEWRCEMRGASALKRSGWTVGLLAPGQEVTVTGSPDRQLGHTCYLGTLIFADGRTYDRYEQINGGLEARVTDRPARRPDGHPNFAGDWAGEQRVMTDPRGIEGAFLPLHIAETLAPGAVPEGTRAFQGARGTPESLAADPIAAAWDRQSPVRLTDAGRKAAEGFDPASTDNPRLDCRPTNILFDWSFDADVNRIEQSGDRLVMKYGFMGMERTIHIGMAEHPDDITPSITGHSIAWWDGDALVVDTIGFTPGVLSADTSTMHSAGMHVTERFTLDPQAMTLTRDYEVADVAYFDGTYGGRDVMHIAEIPYTPASCEDHSFRTDVPGPEAEAKAEKRWWEFWK